MSKEITREQFFEFIKMYVDRDEHISPLTQNYLNYFNKYRKTKSIINWNWSAALFNNAWLFHRKLYWLSLIGFVTCGVLFRLPIHPLLLTLGGLFIFVLFGLFGDFLYFRYVSSLIRKGIEYKTPHHRGISILFYFLVMTISITIELTRNFDRIKEAYAKAAGEKRIGRQQAAHYNIDYHRNKESINQFLRTITTPRR